MCATKLDLLVNELDEARMTLQKHRDELAECSRNSLEWINTMRNVEYFNGIVIGLLKAIQIQKLEEGEEHDMD